jgi:hypothetical protein
MLLGQNALDALGTLGLGDFGSITMKAKLF